MVAGVSLSVVLMERNRLGLRCSEAALETPAKRRVWRLSVDAFRTSRRRKSVTELLLSVWFARVCMFDLDSTAADRSMAALR